MKKTLLTTAAVLTIAGASFSVAAGPHHDTDAANASTSTEVGCGYGGGQKGHRGGGHMLRDLNLSDAQKTQLKALMDQEQLDHQAKVRALLTPEQQATYDARINQHNARRNAMN